MRKIYKKVTLFFLIICLQCNLSYAVNSNNDPYETFNRPIFYFNEWLDKFLFKPAATLYTKIVPKPVSKGLSNFF